MPRYRQDPLRRVDEEAGQRLAEGRRKLLERARSRYRLLDVLRAGVLRLGRFDRQSGEFARIRAEAVNR